MDFKTAKNFTNVVKEKALGQQVLTSIEPGQLLTKIMRDELAELMGSSYSDINLDGKTILVATHDLNNLEKNFDEVLCLNRHCCAYGDPAEVLTEDVIEEMYGSHYEMFKYHTSENHEKNND